MTEASDRRRLASAAIPPIGAADHVRGSGPEATLFLDLACPVCAGAWRQIGSLELRICLRHFPLKSRRPRSPSLHAAAEAAAIQRPDAFWEMVDAICADHGHQDDPHLWARAEALGLDLERFERDRRCAEVAERIRRDFHSGIRAGVVGTPTAFVGGEALTGDIPSRLAALAM